MSIPRALREALVNLGEQAKDKFPQIVSNISDVLMRDSREEATAVFERVRRQIEGRLPVRERGAVAEPSRRTSTWDPEIARDAKMGSSAGPGGRFTRTEGGASSSKRAERRARNQELQRQLNEALKEAKTPEDRARVRREHDEVRARELGETAVSVVGQEGKTRDLRAERRAANQDVNRRLQAKEITREQADAEYAAIRERFNQGVEKRRSGAGEDGGQFDTRARIGDQQVARESQYYDMSHPEARDRNVPAKGGRTRRVPGGADPGLVSAASEVRRHIERMMAAGEIPSHPPDAAMPGIVRTAMAELGVPDQGFDDHAIMRVYRQQGRRNSLYPVNKPGEPSVRPAAPVEGGAEPMDAGNRSLRRMMDRLRNRNGARRTEIEEEFVDDIARDIDDVDLDDIGGQIPGVQLADDVVEGVNATPNDANLSFAQRESIRRSRNRAARQAAQVRRMEEMGEGAMERNEKRATRDERMVGEERDRGPWRSPFSGLEPGGVEGGIRRPDAVRMTAQELQAAIEAHDGSPESAQRIVRMADTIKRQIEMETGATWSPPPGVERDPALDWVEESFPWRESGPMPAGVAFDEGPRNPTGASTFAGGERATREAQISGQADDDIDRLVRILMDRVARWEPARRNAFFESGPLDRQMMLNRDRSQEIRGLMTPETDYRGELIDRGRDLGFPSRLSRPMPVDRDNQSIIAAVLDAVGR